MYVRGGQFSVQGLQPILVFSVRHRQRTTTSIYANKKTHMIHTKTYEYTKHNETNIYINKNLYRRGRKKIILYS